MRLTRRAVPALATIAALTLIAACGSDPAPEPAAKTTSPSPAATTASPTPTSSVIKLAFVIRGGKVSPSVDRVPVPLGSTVEITVASDTADEIHVHGTEDVVELKPGVPATFRLTADQPGIVTVEAHESDLTLVQLQIQ